MLRQREGFQISLGTAQHSRDHNIQIYKNTLRL